MKPLFRQIGSPLVGNSSIHIYQPLEDLSSAMTDNYLNATYQSATDRLSASSSSTEDLTMGSDNGNVDFQNIDDAVMLFAAPTKRSKNTNSRTIMLTSAVLFLTLVCVLLIILVIACKSHLTERNDSKRLCLSNGCIKAASFIQQAIDKTADPCQDFYQFSCGGWKRANPIPDGKSYWGVDSVVWQKNLVTMRQALEKENNTLPINLPSSNYTIAGRFDTQTSAYWKARALYKVCMDDEQRAKIGVKPLTDIIKQLGGFHSADEHLNESFNDKLIEAHDRYSSAAIFATYVTSDDHNSSQNIIKVKQNGLALLPIYYNNSGMSKKIYDAYKSYMVNIRQLLGYTSNASRHQMQEVLAFETELSKIFVAKVNMTDPTEAYQKMNLTELKRLVTTVDWLKLYETMFDGISDIDSSTEVVVASVSYFKSLDAIIKTTPPHVLHNYFTWTVLRGFVAYLTDDFVHAKKPLAIAMEGAYEEMKRWKFCTSYVDGSMGLALGSMFVDRSFAGTSKAEAGEIVEDIRISFEKTLAKLSWMDTKTKASALDKVKAVKQKIGYPSMLLEQPQLDREYLNLVLNNQDGFFASHLKVLHFGVSKNRRKINNPVDKTIWEMTAPQVNAYYNPNGNEIVFPAGILQSPFFHKDFPKAMNYGGIGSVIGHELLHGFDNTGRRFDKYGNSGKPWWTNRSIENFNEKIKCYVEEYSNLFFMGKPIDGQLTLGENLADNGGLKATYKAYQFWMASHGEEAQLPALGMTNMQLFFVAFAQSWCSDVKKAKALYWLNADVHSPNKDRVLGVVKNMPEFASAFNCPKGSHLNPLKRCSLW